MVAMTKLQKAVQRGRYSKAATPKGRTSSHALAQPMFDCTCLDQWHSPKADNYQGLRVTRWLDPLHWQFVADELSKHPPPEDSLHVTHINLAIPEALIQQKFQKEAITLSKSLPPELAKLVSQDAQALAIATHKMLPQARELTMKLELFGENVCSRWHRDKYVCRSLVAYNCSGTDYTAYSNVNFEEFKSGGDNDHIIRKKSLIHNANVGDMVMIKGSKFPGKAKGLIHKSPEVRFYDTGVVQSRLVLKVDISDLGEDEVENWCN